MLLSILWNNVTQVFYSAGRKSASAISANQRFGVNFFLYAVSVLTKVFKVTGSNFWINKSIKNVQNVFFFFQRENHIAERSQHAVLPDGNSQTVRDGGY